MKRTMRRVGTAMVALAMGAGLTMNVHAARKDCGDLPNKPPKPAVEANKDEPNIQNDYAKVVKENTARGVVYLALANGATPKANACGLKPINDAAAWTGWGGPVGAENVTIGEGNGSRNEIVIGGTYYERGVGAHSIATLVYDLTGDAYKTFEAWVGMSDEKDPGECGHGGSGDFVFKVDGKEVAKSPVLKGVDAGVNVPPHHVTFEIPAGAKELSIVMGDGGDGAGCDHSAMGDAKLLTAAALSVEPHGKAASTWGALKGGF